MRFIFHGVSFLHVFLIYIQTTEMLIYKFYVYVLCIFLFIFYFMYVLFNVLPAS